MKKLFNISFLIGLILGIALTAFIMVSSMPGLMIKQHESKYATVEETIEALKKSAADNNWNIAGFRDLKKSMAKTGYIIEKPVTILELCKETHATNILNSDPHISTMLPCALGVYEGEDGKVFISGMNVGLMGKMFGGNIAKVMGNVSDEEKQILQGVIK